MSKKSINRPLKDIAADTGLSEPELSMALNGKRLLGRDKLKKIADANYPLDVFVFGKNYSPASVSAGAKRLDSEHQHHPTKQNEIAIQEA